MRYAVVIAITGTVSPSVLELDRRRFGGERRRPHGSLFFPKFRGCQWRAFRAPSPTVEDH